MHRTSESVASRPEAQAAGIDPAELRAHLDRARELRTEFLAALLRRALGGIVRLLRRAVSAPLRRKPTRRPTRRGPMPLHPPTGPTPESRHAARPNRAA